MSFNRTFVFLLRLALGLLFMFASWDKIIHPQDFAKIIYNYQILPDQLINLAAIVLPWLEMVMGLLLVCGWLPLGTTAWTSFLLALFGGVLTFNLIRGINVHCGCFSTSAGGDPANWLTLVRDMVLLAAGIFLLAANIKKERRTLEAIGVLK
ncbi:MAG: DoxX family membrane protein [Deltaproteobacteria bacterium]|nr:DoxX family membrane protein [Deltaproteobacteria bacterium]